MKKLLLTLVALVTGCAMQNVAAKRDCATCTKGSCGSSCTSNICEPEQQKKKVKKIAEYEVELVRDYCPERVGPWHCLHNDCGSKECSNCGCGGTVSSSKVVSSTEPTEETYTKKSKRSRTRKADMKKVEKTHAAKVTTVE